MLAAIGITGSLLAGTALLASASRANAALLYTSDYVATGPRLDPATVPHSVLLVDTAVTAHVNRTTRTVPALGVTSRPAAPGSRPGRSDW